MCADKEFQLIEGADTEKAREETLLVSLIPAGLVRRFVLEERKHLHGRKIVRNEFRQVERLRGMKCFPSGETQFVGNTMTNR